jgi:hypothetical protein
MPQRLHVKLPKNLFAEFLFLLPISVQFHLSSNPCSQGKMVLMDFGAIFQYLIQIVTTAEDNSATTKEGNSSDQTKDASAGNPAISIVW